MEEPMKFKDCMAMRFRRLGRLMSNRYNEHLRSHGIDISLLNVLFAVAGNPGIHQSEIGKRLILERSTLSRDLQRLKKMGLIDTTKVDGYKSLSLHLTKQGKAKVESMREDWDDIQKQIEDKVGSAISAGIRRLEQALLN
jgi:DNA-binding MarR family transcriptional regulator